MKPEMLQWIIDQGGEGALTVDGFDDAILGMAGDRVVYDYDLMVKVLVDSGDTWEDAVDHLGYNVVSAYVGEQTPLFLNRLPRNWRPTDE